MQIDVSAALSELLYEHQTVVIPGFGGFTSKYQSASVDYVQGAVEPPSKTVEFNPNLQINDGVLAEFLRKKYSISVDEAMTAIQTYVDEQKAILNNKEIIEIPKIGRLYLDYKHNLKYLPDTTNFNTNSFGLPSLKVQPVQRATTHMPPKASVATANTRSAATANAVSTPQQPSYQTITPRQGSLPENWWLWLLCILAVIFMMYSTYTIVWGGDDSDDTQQIDSDRVNKSPLEENDEAIADVVDDPEDEEDFQMDATEEEIVEDESTDETDEAPIDSEAPTIAPDQVETVVIVHTFRSRSNADRMTKKLLNDGYNPHTKKESNLYKVGVLFAAESDSEVDELIAALKQEYKSSPFVWKSDAGRPN